MSSDKPVLPNGDPLLKEGMIVETGTDAVKYVLKIVVGLIIYRLAKYKIFDSTELAAFSAILPIVLLALYNRYKQRLKERYNTTVARMLPRATTLEEFKSVIEKKPDIETLVASEGKRIIPEKEVAKEA